MRTERGTSRTICTRIIWSKSSLSRYFTSAKEVTTWNFLCPYIWSSTERFKSEKRCWGKQIGAFFILLKNRLFLALWLQHHEYERGAKRKDMSLDPRVNTILFIFKISKLTKCKSRWESISCPHSCMHHTLWQMIRVKCTYTVDGIPALHTNLVWLEAWLEKRPASHTGLYANKAKFYTWHFGNNELYFLMLSRRLSKFGLKTWMLQYYVQQLRNGWKFLSF